MALDPADARGRLSCKFAEIDTIFEDCLRKAETAMSPAGIDAWLDGATRVCKLFRGVEPVLIFLEGMPEVVGACDESVIAETADMAVWFDEVPLGPAIRPFLASLAAVARRLESGDSLRAWFRLVQRVTAEGRDGVVELLKSAPKVLELVSLAGLSNWVEFGLRAYRTQLHRLPDFFSLATADAHAVLQRERHGTLLVDVERQLALTQRALWGLDIPLRPYSLIFDALRRPTPHIDKLGMHMPDVLDDAEGISAIDRYRAMMAHMVAHKVWSRPYLADNYSQFQHLAIEVFEDARVEALAMARYPGLRRLFLALHPVPKEDACPEGWSSIRHRLAMLSRALLDPRHSYRDPHILAAVEAFQRRMGVDPLDPVLSAELGVATLHKLHRPDFHLPKIWFEDTLVSYRDDNRYLWQFLEDTDSVDDFHSDHGTPDPEDRDDGVMLPVLYPEWDQGLRAYRPDWATVYQDIQAAGQAGDIDRLLERHQDAAKRIKRVIDRLKPQQRRRVRHQKDGDDLDFDLLIKAMVDVRTGRQPDARVYESHVRDGRDIAVLLLLDLSESIKRPAEGAEISLLQLEQEAVTLLAWAVDALGDAFAVAGFSSETRHQVSYSHIKGFAEHWGPETKARLAGIQAGSNTRMGAALRHAGHLLEQRREEKKVLLLLSDGEPSDVDVDDPEHLKWDTHAAVRELDAKGIPTFCITLDKRADDYIGDVFGPGRYAVVDRVARLPETLTTLFLSLTS
ncbi:MAG: nitric oxide reductase activation protein NorD [Magnetospirillum sp.]|nr:nitric oxide reductase activation protein NorD [Magnetospirillum sp.]